MYESGTSKPAVMLTTIPVMLICCTIIYGNGSKRSTPCINHVLSSMHISNTETSNVERCHIESGNENGKGTNAQW